MKKRAIVLLAFTAALTAASCQKEAMKEAEITPTGEGMTISAVTEGIGADVKADLAYKYDVIWRTGDKICVKNSEKSVDFTLSGGEGTTRGTFSSVTSITGEVEGFYPASVANLVWPAEQQNNQVPPMYCKKNLTSTQNQTFSFASLGSVLQLNFNSTTAGIVLKSIEVKANEAMSGAFTIDEEGKAVISQPEGDKPGITLDLGEGLALGTSAKKFNIAVPAGEYHGLSIVFTATDGKKCTINAKKDKAIGIVFNTVNTLAVSGEFKPDLPAALPGEFSVSGTKKVHFSKGNLYAKKTGENWTWNFYDEQYKYNSIATSSGKRTAADTDTEIDLFTWGYGTWSTSPHSTDFKTGNFTDWGSQIGDGSTWRTLSTTEWQYLFDDRTMVNDGDRYENLTKLGITVEGVTFKGVVLFPDDFIEQTTWKEKYTTWKALNDAGLVFLPAAGYRNGSSVDNVGFLGLYWSSTAKDEYDAYYVYFDDRYSAYPYSTADRCYGVSVRLITEASVTPAPTPTTTGTAKATIGGIEVDVNWVQLWENGPKFAEYNVGSTMTFIDAIKTGAEYEWGANWCTPSKDQMDELLKAATSEGSTKVVCTYTQENSQWGFKFTGKEEGYTGNSVFFHAVYGEGDFGDAYYWSATADSGGTSWRMRLCYGEGDFFSDWGSFAPTSEFLVRPVLRN